MIKPPYYPIVYVRGYAGSQSEVEDTVATPYMGFNLGSTKMRQLWDGEITKYIFESPLIRLMKDHGYSDVYSDGQQMDEQPISAKSIWIYRYYESVSKDLGSGDRPPIDDYAKGLDVLIEKIRDQVCGTADANDPAVTEARDNFRVHLIAHSMGGLISRCYLQNIFPTRAPDEKPPVDKVFTYATPHGGIDLRGIGNIPGFLRVNNMDNFNEKRMREYLNLTSSAEPVHSLGGHFDPQRFFSLVGTNYRDYPAAKGLASAAVGPMSDGLVQIKNAAVDKTPRAFVHRSHSGPYGIVNSEEGYQNLRRFLFGDVRVELSLQIDDVILPAAIEKKRLDGHRVRASYHAESVVRVRGARWDMHRRLVGESSAHFLPYDRIVQAKPIRLFTGYLSMQSRVKKRGPMGFTLDLGILVPEYEVDRKWRLDQHFDGGHIFRDKINFDLAMSGDTPVLKYGMDSKTPNRATRKLEQVQGDNALEFHVPIVQNSKPGIDAKLIITASSWN